MSQPTLPESGQGSTLESSSVHLSRHRVDWDDSDLAEGTARRVMALGDLLSAGYWYLNPRYTVSAPAPTAAFFARVRDRRSAWLRTCRQSLSTPGHRRLAREVQRQGRREALAFSYPAPVPEDLPEAILWRALSQAERREVVAHGHLAKGLAFSGVMFIDGVLLQPQAWNATAEDLLGPESVPKGPPRHTNPASPATAQSPPGPTVDHPSGTAKRG